MLCRSVCALLLVCLALAAAEPPGGDEWKYDVIHRRQGVPLSGLVLEQGAVVKIRCISRKPGSPTITFIENVPRREIARLELLDETERKRLEQRLESLKHEREVRATHLLPLDPKGTIPGKSGDAFDLRPIDWPGNRKAKALAYQSGHFRLIADCRPGLVQLAALHLEQVYAAYARALKPRKTGTTTAATTTILLTGSLAEYQAIAKSRGLNLFNPAFYDPKRNQVVCGSDLEKLCDDLALHRKTHAQRREKMKENKAALMRVYHGKVPTVLLKPMLDEEEGLVAFEKRLTATIAGARQRLFARLYHEAFHAYLNTYVYPAREGPLPHWFNEGLAQIFESAIVEVGELRVGHADAKRLTAVRQALARDTLLPLATLLTSQPKQFQVAHAGDQLVSDRYYLASWGLTFYLTFEKRLLGTEALDKYVQALKRGTAPLLAFRDLVGTPLPQFEEEYLQYLKKLRPDGTTTGK